jgi:predicted AAA+ superfamily ATPase
MLEHNSSLKNGSLINQILNKDLAKPPNFEIPILKPDKIQDAFHIVEHGIKEFQMNEDQSEVIKNVAAILVGSQKENIALVHGVFGCGKSTLV